MRFSIVRGTYTIWSSLRSLRSLRSFIVVGAMVACVGGSTVPGEEATSSGGSSGSSGAVVLPAPGRPPSSTPPAPPAPRDAGKPKPDGSPGTTCSNNTQKEIFVSVECQACLEKSCCTELKGCFNMTVPAGKLDCNAYEACYDTCASDPEPAVCTKNCETSAGAGIAAAFETIAQCGTDNCATECQ